MTEGNSDEVDNADASDPLLRHDDQGGAFTEASEARRSGELEAFLSSSRREAQLAASDLEFVRVIDDLLDVLIDKGVINFTDLPSEAQTKFLRRSELRRQRDSLDLLEDDELF